MISSIHQLSGRAWSGEAEIRSTRFCERYEVMSHDSSQTKIFVPEISVKQISSTYFCCRHYFPDHRKSYRPRLDSPRTSRLSRTQQHCSEPVRYTFSILLFFGTPSPPIHENTKEGIFGCFSWQHALSLTKDGLISFATQSMHFERAEIYAHVAVHTIAIT